MHEIMDNLRGLNMELNWFCMMQGTQKEYPKEVLPFYKETKDKKTENVISKFNDSSVMT